LRRGFRSGAGQSDSPYDRGPPTICCLPALTPWEHTRANDRLTPLVLQGTCPFPHKFAVMLTPPAKWILPPPSPRAFFLVPTCKDLNPGVKVFRQTNVLFSFTFGFRSFATVPKLGPFLLCPLLPPSTLPRSNQIGISSL